MSEPILLNPDRTFPPVAWGVSIRSEGLGNPSHYSLELPVRCLQLIEGLWPHAERLHEPGRAEAGPLTTTFLLAMAMPMIVLPVERLERQLQRGIDEGYADDRYVGPAVLAKSVAKELGGGSISKSLFFQPDTWSYCHWDDPTVNVARGLPHRLTLKLAAAAAFDGAASLRASQWCSILRNALAHGGIAYLNREGQSTAGERAEMLCFVSGDYNKQDKKTLEGVHCLRISEADFRHFLCRWVEWLNSSGITNLMAA
jgi:hypothetical protein